MKPTRPKKFTGHITLGLGKKTVTYKTTHPPLRVRKMKPTPKTP